MIHYLHKGGYIIEKNWHDFTRHHYLFNWRNFYE